MESGIVNTTTVTMHRSGIIRRCIRIIQRHFREFTFDDVLLLRQRQLNRNGELYGASQLNLQNSSFNSWQINFQNLFIYSQPTISNETSVDLIYSQPTISVETSVDCFDSYICDA